MMCEPRQRGAYVSEKCGWNLPEPQNPVIDYCAHCLNGGSKGVVAQYLPPSGWDVYDPLKDFDGTATRAGLCGDAVGNNDHMIGGTFVPDSYGGAPIVSHYRTGANVDFIAEIDTNHNGYFEFFLCNLDSCGTKDISGKCFKDGKCYRLERVPHPDCENPSEKTHTECGPIDEKYPGRWYVPCRATDHVGVHIVGGSSGTMRYKLPDGVSCEHCVIQWYWATANSCAPRGFLDYMIRKNRPFGSTCPSDGGGLGAFRDGMSECGGTSLPEEFWTCSDVTISRNGNSTGSNPPSTNSNDSNGSDSGDDASTPTPMPTVTPTSSPVPAQTPWSTPTPTSMPSSTPAPTSNTSDSGDQTSSNDTGGRKGCVNENEECGVSNPCCDSENQVCVLSANEEKPTCRLWWSLGTMLGSSRFS